MWQVGLWWSLYIGVARGTRAARGAIIVLHVCKGALSLDAAEINS